MASGNTLCVFTPGHMEPPASNYAQLNTRNSILVLDYDTTTEETACFRSVLPAHYSGGGLTIDVYWVAASATSGAVVWGGAMEREQDGGSDLDADSFATEQLAGAVTTSGTSGVVNKSTITMTSGANMDSLGAGEPFRFKLARKPTDGSDTMAGDAEMLAIHIKET